MQYLTLLLFHYFLLRLYSVLRADNRPVIPPDTPTNTGAPTPAPQQNIVPLAVGLAFGLLTLAITVLCAFCLQRRRRRKSALLDARATPPHHTPLAQVKRLSDAPQESERSSQPTQPSTYELTLSSGAPTATTVPIGMPPSQFGLFFPVGGSSSSGEVAKIDLATPAEVIEILDDDETGHKPPKATGWWDVNNSRSTQG